MGVVLVDGVLVVALFFLVNWLGRHSSTFGYLQLSLNPSRDEAPAFNMLLKTLTPAVFILLVSVGLYASQLDGLLIGIWIVAPAYFCFRIAYNILFGRVRLLNWSYLVAQLAIGTTAAYCAYKYLILPKRPLLPGADAIGEQIWTILALFCYAILNNVRTSSKGSVRRKNRYIRARFNAFRQQYGGLIENQFPERYMELVAYAILIYETFNRPWIARSIERLVFPWGSHTLGPMQVRTDAWLSDRDSVETGVKELRRCFVTTKEEQIEVTYRSSLIRRSIAKFNRDENYISEVLDVLHVLWAQVATSYREDFEHEY